MSGPPGRMTAVVLRVKEACVTPCPLAGSGKRPDVSPECFKYILSQHGCVYDITGKRAVGISEGAAAHGVWSSLLPGETFTPDMSKAQADSLLRADLRKLCRMCNRFGKDVLLLSES